MSQREALRALQARLAERLQSAAASDAHAAGWLAVECAGLGLLLPLAGALAALLMAIAIRCRSVKEAQASATVLVLAVSLLPLLTMFNRGSEAAWHLWVPVLAQLTLMGRVLKGEPIAPGEVLLVLVVCAALAAVCLAYVARRLRRAALS
jgi:sodium transport system permease protein